jgi:hypothetical protein
VISLSHAESHVRPVDTISVTLETKSVFAMIISGSEAKPDVFGEKERYFDEDSLKSVSTVARSLDTTLKQGREES